MPEARLSADGLYYWDGAQWISTLSPDGRSRWSGSQWVAVGKDFASASYYQAPRSLREPTSWTKPLQYAVAGWYAISAAYSLTLPFWMSGPTADAMNQSFQRQQRLYPTATPPPADFTNMMASMTSGILWVSAVIGVALCIVVIVGALNRWNWLYYAVLVLSGFGLISLPVDIINLITGGPLATTGFNLPHSTLWLGVASGIPNGALFVWMLVALIKRGPWAMKRVAV